MHEVGWLKLRGPAGDEGPDGDCCLAVEGLAKRFGDSQELYEDLNLRIRRGEIVVIIGESGIGKSVFLKHLIGIEEPSQGSVWYRTPGPIGIDCPIHLFSEYDMKEIRQEIGMVFQASSLFDWMTVFENVSLPLDQHRDRLERQLARFAGHPHELFLLLGRLAEPPGPFGAFQRKMVPVREALSREFKALQDAFMDAAQADELCAGLAQVLGAHQARESIAGPVHALGRSPWNKEDSPLSPWSAESLGSMLAGAGAESLPAPLNAFTADYVTARQVLRATYADVRSRWGRSFGDLAATIVLWWLKRSDPDLHVKQPLTDLLDRAGLKAAQRAAAVVAVGPTTDRREATLVAILLDWLRDAEVELPTGATFAPRALIRHILRCLKCRPSLLARALEAAGPDLPPSLAPLVQATAKFREQIDRLEARLVDIGGDRSRLWAGLALAWLAGHPMPVDRTATARALLGQILDAFQPRPELLGRILTEFRRPDLPPAIVRYLEGYDTFGSAFRREYAGLTGHARRDLVDAFIELMVAGLMSSLKLDPIQDRDKLPSQLSGGMKTRVGLARALAMMPEVVLYDEPTAGLDPVLSQSIAREILELQMAGVVSTSVVVTHDKDLYNTLRLAGRTRMLYLSGGAFLDAESRQVRDLLRAGDRPTKRDAVTIPGVRGYPPAVFIREFEPRDTPAP